MYTYQIDYFIYSFLKMLFLRYLVDHDLDCDREHFRSIQLTCR